MRDPKNASSTVRWTNVDLAHSTVQRCLRDGMEITHLAFEFGNLLSGVLDANGALTKLTLLGVDDAPTPNGEDDALAQQDAEIALLGGTLRSLLGCLRRTLGGEQPAAELERRPADHTVIGTPAAPAEIVTGDRAEAVWEDAATTAT
jgi:DNA recombination-dependent growth factor C